MHGGWLSSMDALINFCFLSLHFFPCFSYFFVGGLQNCGPGKESASGSKFLILAMDPRTDRAEHPAFDLVTIPFRQRTVLFFTQLSSAN
jgi:hypothetical protein